MVHVNESKEPLFPEVGYFKAADESDPAAAMEVEVAFQWNTGFQTDGLHSFANGINTIEGGTHLSGFRSALTRTSRRWRTGLSCVASATTPSAEPWS